MARLQMHLVFLTVYLISVVTESHETATASWQPLNPEETFFGFSRCLEIHGGTGEQLQQHFLAWSQWNLDDGKEDTKCFTKCLLEYLEIYNSTTVKYTLEGIIRQHEKYKSVTNTDKSMVDEFVKKLESIKVTEDSCDSVYKSYTSVYGNFKDLSKKLFHGEPEILPKLYSQGGKDVKQVSQSFPEFCDEKHCKKGKDFTCKLLQLQIDGNMPCTGEYVDCLFKGYRYFDRNGNLNASEIIRDFHDAESSVDSDTIVGVFNDCQEEFPNPSALDYMTCLLIDHATSDDFKRILHLRAAKSNDYLHFLKPKSVEELVKKLEEKTKSICS